jgi:phosphatidate phosphatase APP1
LAVIEPLLQGFPARKFILIGDSAEQDPEVYGMLARRYPDQVVQVYIRDVTDEPADAPRYQAAFRDLPPDKWQLFHDPASLSWPVDPPTQ